MLDPKEQIKKALLLLGCLLAVAAGAEPGYLLHTRRNPEAPQRISADVESLLRSSYFALDPTVISLPRWRANGSTLEHLTIVAAQLGQRACNVITVDLSESDQEAEIIDSVSRLLLELHQQLDVPLAQLLLVGFDAGAHLAGAVAERLTEKLGQRLPQITALDPSSGLTANLSHALSAKDASFVEVIHTNGDALERLGHVDYYPNGGQQQPGCEGKEEEVCSHERVLQLAAEMWSPANEFLIAKCDNLEQLNASRCRWSTLKMGLNEQARAGIFFLETRTKAPFGRGSYYIGFL